MFSIQRIARISGWIFILVAVLGFTPLGSGMQGIPGMGAMSGQGMLLGMFPVNALHNAAHLVFGIWGVWAGSTQARSVAYALGSGAAYLTLAIIGMLTPTLLNIPLGGYDVVLHLVLAVVLAGAGFWAVWSPAEGERVSA